MEINLPESSVRVTGLESASPKVFILIFGAASVCRLYNMHLEPLTRRYYKIIKLQMPK